MKKPEVLIITGALPYPLVTGAKIRTFNLMKALASQFDIELLTVVSTAEAVTYLEEFSKVGIVTHHIIRPEAESRFIKICDAFLSLVLRDPYLIRHYNYRAYRKRLDSLLAERHYDVIHCDSISMTGSLRGLDKQRLVLTEHNLEQNIWAGYTEHASGFLKKLFYRNQYSKVKKLEESLDDIYGQVVTVSENDKKLLSQSFPEESITVVENGVDPAAYVNDSTAEKRSGVIFTGSLDWHPNIDGLQWFADEIYPALIAALPPCQTTIVGRKPARALITAMQNKNGVKVYPDVPEIQPYLHTARVMMVPLRIGGGSRLKILEAMAAGLPVVSTSKGAEGLAVTDGENIIIEDNPLRFAEVLVKVLQDDELYLKLSRQGRALIENRYSWEQVARPLADLWRKVAHA
jgi:glycosyltransferase involved in cell wall biosynthesis